MLLSAYQIVDGVKVAVEVRHNLRAQVNQIITATCKKALTTRQYRCTTHGCINTACFEAQPPQSQNQHSNVIAPEGTDGNVKLAAGGSLHQQPPGLHHLRRVGALRCQVRARGALNHADVIAVLRGAKMSTPTQLRQHAMAREMQPSHEI